MTYRIVYLTGSDMNILYLRSFIALLIGVLLFACPERLDAQRIPFAVVAVSTDLDKRRIAIQ